MKAFTILSEASLTNADQPYGESASSGKRSTFPLYLQVLLAVVCGAALGAIFGTAPFLGGVTNEQLGQFGMLVIKLLKTLAVPLIFFAILDAFMRTSLPLRQGTKLLVMLALIFGAALRRVRTHADPAGNVQAVARGIEVLYQMHVQMLAWIIKAVPFAVFGVIAQVVGKSGVGVFSALWIFLAAMLLGLGIHSLVYYPLVAWVVGRKSPRVYIGQGADAILTAVSCNSSLATVPVTLRCLDRMKVSVQSSRLAACVGTNLNNDGITLYEAMAALFLAQALGFDLPMMNQVMIVAASVMAGAGVAGIPEAGLVVLPLVLAAAGLPDHVIAAAMPLIMTVDWIIARVRSGVNVMSDMLVAILLDRKWTKSAAVEPITVPFMAARPETVRPTEQ